MSFFENTRKPAGFGGKLMVVMMNLGHSPVARSDHPAPIPFHSSGFRNFSA